MMVQRFGFGLVLLLLLVGCERAQPPGQSSSEAPPRATAQATAQAAAGDASVLSADSGNGNQALLNEDASVLDLQDPATVKPMEIDWDALIPTDWNPEAIMAKYDVDALQDSDPKAQELMKELKAFWKAAPVVQELDGQWVKLPGFVVPMEMDATDIDEFLLVPYYGACIHVPPPPSNQTVHVLVGQKGSYQGEVFDTVWVIGQLHIDRFSSDLADAGYRIDQARVLPYEEE